jgi:hypothetical protein
MNFLWDFHLLFAALVLSFSSSLIFGETTFSRVHDFRAASLGGKNDHTHGGLLAANDLRWSYFLLTDSQRREIGDPGILLADPNRLRPLSGFVEIFSGLNHFRRHHYQVSQSGVFLSWNRNLDNPDTKLARASLAVVFHPPAAGTYSITGDLLWRSALPTEMRRGAGIDIGIVRGQQHHFEVLFSASFMAPDRFSEPLPVPGFSGNPALQNLKLSGQDRIVFLWHADSQNYRGLEGIDREVRIVHAEGDSPSLDPDKIEELITYQQLFSLIDLDRPDLKEIRSLLMVSDLVGAMHAYIRIMAGRLAKLPRRETFQYWLYGVASADELLEGILTTVEYGDNRTRYTFEIGKPGSIDFFRAATPDYRTTIRDNSSMFWATKHAEAYQQTRDPKYLQAWLATWDDFARNWEAQYAATREVPGIWDRGPDGRTRLLGIDWLNAQLYLAWRLEAMHAGLIASLQTALDADHLDQIDKAMLVRILIRASTVETARSRNWLPRAESLVPNQIRHLASALFAWGVHFSEFRDSKGWRDESIPIFTLTHNPDGTDREHSLNYFRNNLTEVLELIRQLPPAERDPKLVADLEHRSAYRDRVTPALVRPDGFLPTVGKNNVWRDFGKSVPVDPPSGAFASILFPYNGFAVQRDGWEPKSLYLMMRGNRPNMGHWRAQDGGLQLSAYGRNLLVSAIGEVYVDRNYQNGWNGYFYSAAGQNTILVDGMSHRRRTQDFDQLDDTLWHSSDGIEFMETRMTEAYGGWDFRVDGNTADRQTQHGRKQGRDEVTGITHRRQVHFLKNAGLWIVTDRVQSEGEHDFTQTWCFGPEYAENEIMLESADRRIRTRQPGAPNLRLHQFGSPELEYAKYFGVNNENRILGWTGILADHEAWQYTPKVDTHVNWRGRGPQLLITLLEPTPNADARIKSVEAFAEGDIHGFDAGLMDGSRISYRAANEALPLEADGVRATAKSLLVLRDREGSQYGMVLGAERFGDQQAQHPDFEFQQIVNRREGTSESMNQITAIFAPTGFRWEETATGLKPVYVE